MYFEINKKKKRQFIIYVCPIVRITGVSITRDADNYRHISVGRRLSIEKEGIENCYSEKMKEIIQEKGYKNLDKMIRDLGEQHEDSSTHG